MIGKPHRDHARAGRFDLPEKRAGIADSCNGNDAFAFQGIHRQRTRGSIRALKIVLHQVDYRDIDFRLVTFKHRGTASFLGMIMQSPFGPLQLQDGWFKHGTAVGAAVIMHWSVADAAHRGG